MQISAVVHRTLCKWTTGYILSPSRVMQTQILCRVAVATPVQRFSYAKCICIIVLVVVALRLIRTWGSSETWTIQND